MSVVAVELQDVSLVRGHRRILSVEELRVPAGSFLGIIGPNGAGKTTLLRVCACLIVPDAGQVNIFGQNPRHISAWQRSSVRRLVGYVPQTVEYMPDLPFTTRDIVSMGLYGRKGFLRKLNAEDRRKVDVWIERLGLRALSNSVYRSLSGGERQKALLARAMVQEPSLVLLDEPAANLDLDWKEQLVQLIEELFVNFEVTIVMVSHETWQLPPSCKQVALMKGGEIVFLGQKSEALSNGVLSQLYGCRVETVVRGDRFHALSAGGGEKERSCD